MQVFDRMNDALLRHFPDQATFTSGAWSGTFLGLFAIEEADGTLAGQRTGTNRPVLHIRESDHDSRMSGASVVVRGSTYVVRDVDPDPVEGMRRLLLRRGHE